MDIGHERRYLGMSGHKIIGHVARVACRIAQSQNAVYRRKTAEQLSQRGRPTVTIESMIGVYILSDKRDLAHPGQGQALHFGGNLFDGPRNFTTARIGHDAESAELVATFLHGHESGNAAP